MKSFAVGNVPRLVLATTISRTSSKSAFRNMDLVDPRTLFPNGAKSTLILIVTPSARRLDQIKPAICMIVLREKNQKTKRARRTAERERGGSGEEGKERKYLEAAN